MTIRIRKAEKKDAKKLSELLITIAQLHHDGRPDIYGAGGAKHNIADVEKKIENKDELILVAVNEDDVVMGYTMSKIIDVEENGILLAYRKMYIDDVCVDSSARKLGIGRKLMEETKKEAEKCNCHIVELNVWSFNESAVEFYKSCGMTVQRMYMEYVLD
jgi:ribosomal protein S18 acetylase RimI-like enzyme